MWWAWAAYSWLTDTLDTEADRVRLVMFFAMGAMFVVGLAIPHAFNDDALVFAMAYAMVRAAHILLSDTRPTTSGVQQAIKRLAPPAFIGSALLIGASFFDGTAQGLLWGLAIAIDFIGPVVAGMEGWVLHPGHFAERYGLIIIIAFGESIVAIGLGAAGVELTWQIVFAAMSGIALAAALWWAYFDVDRAGGRASPARTQGARPAADGARLLQLHPPADDHGDRADRPRGQEDDRADAASR